MIILCITKYSIRTCHLNWSICVSQSEAGKSIEGKDSNLNDFVRLYDQRSGTSIIAKDFASICEIVAVVSPYLECQYTSHIYYIPVWDVHHPQVNDACTYCVFPYCSQIYKFLYFRSFSFWGLLPTFHSFIHSGHCYSAPSKSSTTQRRSRLQYGYCIGVSRRSAL